MRKDGASAWLVKLTACLVPLCVSHSIPSHAEQRSASLPEMVEIPLSPLPFTLQGLLRRPEGKGRSPAIVLLPGCTTQAKLLDENWGARISSWGYVTLTIDSFGPRGIKNCERGNTDPSDLVFDAYRGLNFLIQKRFIDQKRAAIVGFAAGGWQTLAAVERGAVE